MGRSAIWLAMAGMLLFAEPFVWGQRKGGDTRKAGRSETVSRTGCLDQEGEDYVLRDDRTLTRVAKLEAVGFPNDGFAKYVGQKVKAEGKVGTTAGETVLLVRKVEVISERCAPQSK